MKSIQHRPEPAPERRTPHGVRGLKSKNELLLWKRGGRTPHGVRGLKLCGGITLYVHVMSHPSRGAWIEITTAPARTNTRTSSHPSRGAWIEIGNKSAWSAGARSHPSRGAWIEIGTAYGEGKNGVGRTPHGVRGLKLYAQWRINRVARRTPHGVRGLKYLSSWPCALATGRTPHGVRGLKSAPHTAKARTVSVAPLTGCVD